MNRNVLYCDLWWSDCRQSPDSLSAASMRRKRSAVALSRSLVALLAAADAVSSAATRACRAPSRLRSETTSMRSASWPAPICTWRGLAHELSPLESAPESWHRPQLAHHTVLRAARLRDPDMSKATLLRQLPPALRLRPCKLWREPELGCGANGRGSGARSGGNCAPAAAQSCSARAV